MCLKLVGISIPLAKFTEKQKKIQDAFPLRGTDKNKCAILDWIAIIHRSCMITNLPGILQRLLFDRNAVGDVGCCTFYF